MKYWLVKSEPNTYSFSNLLHDKKTVWDGVRNFAARNHLRAMQPRDQALFYHSGDDKAVMGLAEVVKAAYPDPSAKEGDWSAVDLQVVKALLKPVSLSVIKSTPSLQEMPLIRQSRLSVMPVTQAEFKKILTLGGL